MTIRNAALDLIFAGIILAFVVWLIVRSVLRAEEPKKHILRLVCSMGLVMLTVAACAFLFAKLGRFAAFAVPFTVAASGILLGVMWASRLGEILAAPLSGLFDGGNAKAFRQPLYAIAEARQKRGRYQEAITEAQKQLEEFPGDITGTLLLIDLFAKDLDQIEDAKATLEAYLQNGPHHSKNIFRVLAHMADIYIEKYSDRESAKNCLECIQSLCPGTDQEMIAAQRLAHMGSREFLAAKKQPTKIIVKEFDHRLGLQGKEPDFQRNEKSPDELAKEYIQQLNEHPLNLEARENLALLYANHYHRLDMAIEQLETMVNHRNQSTRQVVRWLNLMADLHIKLGGNIRDAKKCLQRISDRFPTSAHDTSLGLNRRFPDMIEAKYRRSARCVVLPDRRRQTTDTPADSAARTAQYSLPKTPAPHLEVQKL